MAKIINFKQTYIPVYTQQEITKFLPYSYFWEQLNNGAVLQSFQFWLYLWLNKKIFTKQENTKLHTDSRIETLLIDTEKITDKIEEVFYAFYNKYGQKPEYIILGIEEYQKLHFYQSYWLKQLDIKILLLPSIQGIIALPNLTKLNWKLT